MTDLTLREMQDVHGGNAKLCMMLNIVTNISCASLMLGACLIGLAGGALLC